MQELISLKAFGLDELTAVRYYTAMLMAERGVVSAPNMAIGAPYFVGGTFPTMPIERSNYEQIDSPPAAQIASRDRG